MTLRHIRGNEVRDFVKWLKKEQCGCCHFMVGETAEYEIDICVGWHEYDEGDWRIAWKIGMQSFNNAMQCDLDIDWDMPYNRETGDVFDTLEEIADCDTMRKWNDLAARMNRIAYEAFNFELGEEERERGKSATP